MLRMPRGTYMLWKRYYLKLECLEKKEEKVYKWYPLGLQHYATVYLIKVYLIRSHEIVCLAITSAISNLYSGETGNYLCDTAKSSDDIP